MYVYCLETHKTTVQSFMPFENIIKHLAFYPDILVYLMVVDSSLAFRFLFVSTEYNKFAVNALRLKIRQNMDQFNKYPELVECIDSKMARAPLVNLNPDFKQYSIFARIEFNEIIKSFVKQDAEKTTRITQSPETEPNALPMIPALISGTLPWLVSWAERLGYIDRVTYGLVEGLIYCNDQIHTEYIYAMIMAYGIHFRHGFPSLKTSPYIKNAEKYLKKYSFKMKLPRKQFMDFGGQLGDIYAIYKIDGQYIVLETCEDPHIFTKVSPMFTLWTIQAMKYSNEYVFPLFLELLAVRENYDVHPKQIIQLIDHAAKYNKHWCITMLVDHVHQSFDQIDPKKAILEKIYMYYLISLLKYKRTAEVERYYFLQHGRVFGSLFNTTDGTFQTLSSNSPEDEEEYVYADPNCSFESDHFIKKIWKNVILPHNDTDIVQWMSTVHLKYKDVSFNFQETIFSKIAEEVGVSLEVYYIDMLDKNREHPAILWIKNHLLQTDYHSLDSAFSFNYADYSRFDFDHVKEISDTTFVLEYPDQKYNEVLTYPNKGGIDLDVHTILPIQIIIKHGYFENPLKVFLTSTVDLEKSQSVNIKFNGDDRGSQMVYAVKITKKNGRIGDTPDTFFAQDLEDIWIKLCAYRHKSFFEFYAVDFFPAEPDQSSNTCSIGNTRIIKQKQVIASILEKFFFKSE